MSEHCFAESGDFVVAPASTLKSLGPILLPAQKILRKNSEFSCILYIQSVNALKHL
jgi:hypothetical protein